MESLGKLAAVNATSRRVWALAAPFFRSEEKWKARAMLAAIVLLNLAAVYMLVLQRIQEDLNLFTSYSISLSMGLLNALVTLASFVGILWSLIGDFTFSVGGHSYEIAGFMVWAAVAYCIAGSVITHSIGRPQIARVPAAAGLSGAGQSRGTLRASRRAIHTVEAQITTPPIRVERLG